MAIQNPLFTRHRKSHFAPAFLFLEPKRRHALKVLYAVCRLLDDAVDIKSDDPDEATVKVYFTAAGQGPKLCATPDNMGIIDFGTTWSRSLQEEW